MRSNLLLVSVTLALLAGCAKTSPRSSTASPRAALDVYLMGLKQGNLAVVRSVYYSDRPDFQFHLSGPIPMESYNITKELVFDTAEAKRHNERGVVPPAEPADVQLDVEERIDGQAEMYSYWLRLIDGKWLIYAHTAWNAPD